MVKMINYIRREVQQGNEAPDLSSREPFQEECYLKPFLDHDPLLYSLEDIVGSFDRITPTVTNGDMDELPRTEDLTRSRIATLEMELDQLRRQFSAYRETVDKTLENRWNDNVENGTADSRNAAISNGIKTIPRDDDSHYFSSYSSNGQWKPMRETVETTSLLSLSKISMRSC